MTDTDVDAGQLTRRLTLQADVGTDSGNNTTGEHVPNWLPWGNPSTRWAGIRQLRGREIERAMTLQIEATHLITLRYVPGVTPLRMRGVMGSRVFEFGAVDDVDDAHVKLEILACERIA